MAMRHAISAFAVLAAGTACFAAQGMGAPPTQEAVELIRDPHFDRGFQVYDPKPGKKVLRDTLRWAKADGDDSDDPIWGLAQWSTKHYLAGAEPEPLPSGAVRYANVAKTVIVGPAGSQEADLVLGVDSRPEWGDQARQPAQKWPHLLVEQRLPDCPPLTDLAALRFRVRARLLHAERFETPDYSPRLHAAHFLIHFTVQNLNRQSPGHGDFLWLGVPVYDDRWPVPRKHVAGDKASGKMIYDPGGAAYTTESLHTGQWGAIETDLLPIALEALETAWERGFLQGSRDVVDYRIGGMNMGWEVTGINNVAVQVRDLSLRAFSKKGLDGLPAPRQNSQRRE